MRQYQLDGLNWFISRHENGVGGILGDEMGLGKTMQTISFLGYLKTVQKVKGPHLVVVPLSVLQNWLNEFKRWCPALKVIRFHGPQKVRNQIASEVAVHGTFDVVVTTYEMIVHEEDFFCNKHFWHFCILDEAHRVKNENTLQSLAFRKIFYLNAFLLTGTPTQNNMHELWALINFLYPALFKSSEPFDKCFDLAKSMVDNSLLEKAPALLQSIMCRRVKANLESKLPPKTETKVYVSLSKVQNQWYKKLLAQDLGTLNLKDDGSDGES